MGQGHFNSFKSIFPVSHFFVGWGVAQKTRERKKKKKRSCFPIVCLPLLQLFLRGYQKFLFYIVKGFVGFFFFFLEVMLISWEKEKRKEKKRRRVVLTWVGVERKKVGICH
jgi:4-amino-4-deoxy-L-arabinose transferase-like glycosyltransferase